MWQFTIIDYSQNPTNPQSTIIQEPVGWDAVNLHLKRDETGHGFFGFEDDTFSSLQYDGNGAAILRAAYYTYGIQAKVQLAVTYTCDGQDPDNNLYLGTFDFTTFKDYIADRCYVECATLVSEAYYLFKNRKDQQVDLDSLASFDQQPVEQTIQCQAIFSEQYLQIRVNVLLNGLLAGSKIGVSNASQTTTLFTVASAKPDYTNVNPDGTFAYTIAPPTVSATFNATNNTISINQLINIDAGSQINVAAAQFNELGVNYDNSGIYNVLSVQQFFNYTVLNIGTIQISDHTVGNYPNRMIDLSADSVTVAPVGGGSFMVASQPTSTIIQVIEPLHDETVAQATVTGLWQKNNLPAYNALSKLITIPAKQINATSKWFSPQQKIYELADKGVGDRQTPFLMIITPDWPNVQSDIDETDPADGVPIWKPDANNPPDTILYYRQQSLACQGTGSLKVNVAGSFIDNRGKTSDIPWIIAGNPITKGTPDIQPNRMFLVAIKDTTWQGISGYDLTSPQVILSHEFDFSSSAESSFKWAGEIDNITINPGEYVWIFFHFIIGFAPDGKSAPELVLDAQSYFEFTLGSTCEDTPCSVYLVNEALSRCTESYTNGQIQVYSDYFGRTNAQPVASPADGCGALAAITSGLRIRGCLMPDGSAIPKFFTSLNDMFTALDAIHNIGMGMEADPNRPGMLRLRVEPFQHWFPDAVIPFPDVPNPNAPVLQGVMNYTRQVQSSLLCSTFKCGYQQFETWNNNGLYDIFGDRTYRTPLNHLENEIDKTCKWMASDYAIEFTRRQFGLTSSDGRYDDATFILCLKNQITQQVYFYGYSALLILTDITLFPGWNIHDSCSITGSLANNLSNITITGIAVIHLNNIAYTLFTFSGTVFNWEKTGGATLTNNTSGSSVMNGAWYFWGANGAAVLSDAVFSFQPGDTILFSNTTSNNNSHVIDNPINNMPESGGSVVSLGAGITTEVASNCNIHDATSPMYLVEQGMANGTNLLSPQTVMNYRISPAHAAMRHYRNIITDRQYAGQNLIFTGGTGNFYALGTLADGCTPESDNLSEGSYLSLNNFAVQNDGKPLFYPEIIKFEYPLTWAQFLAIQQSPYGLIQYEHANDGVQQGWITDLQYHPYTGLAEFTLYPKI